jgi:tetratricopeptide (TPR) repeat protein
MAEEELRRALISDPENPLIHSTLAVALLGQEKRDAALEEARGAILRGPDIGYCHYVHAVVLKSMGQGKEAQEAIEIAIGIEPGDVAYWGVLAGIHADKQRWAQALEAADQGMKIDPENEQCVNLRAIALVHLNRRDEAGTTIDTALGNNPHSAVTHANMGWTLLHKGDPKTAMTHFKEALRIDPNQEWARAGIVEALKARNFIYRMFLGYTLWMSRLDPRVRWAVVVGMVVLMQFTRAFPTSGPMYWVALGLILAYFVFVLTVWTAEPLFDLILRFDRYGRLVLSNEQRRDSNWIALGMVLIVGMLGVALWHHRYMDGLVYVMLAIPLGVTLSTPDDRRRILPGLVTAGLFVVAGLFCYGWITLNIGPDTPDTPETQAYIDAFVTRQRMYVNIVMWGSAGMTWVAPMFGMGGRRR